jgi:transcriptional regulator with XRE-family HTH domain
VQFKDKLRGLRSRDGLSLQQVADAVKVSKAHVWELETGRSRNPSLEILQRLAEHFRVSIAYLVDDPDDDQPRAKAFLGRNAGAIESMHDDDLRQIEMMMKHLAKARER